MPGRGRGRAGGSSGRGASGSGGAAVGGSGGKRKGSAGSIQKVKLASKESARKSSSSSEEELGGGKSAKKTQKGAKTRTETQKARKQDEKTLSKSLSAWEQAEKARENEQKIREDAKVERARKAQVANEQAVKRKAAKELEDAKRQEEELLGGNEDAALMEQPQDGFSEEFIAQMLLSPRSEVDENVEAGEITEKETEQQPEQAMEQEQSQVNVETETEKATEQPMEQETSKTESVAKADSTKSQETEQPQESQDLGEEKVDEEMDEGEIQTDRQPNEQLTSISTDAGSDDEESEDEDSGDEGPNNRTTFAARKETEEMITDMYDEATRSVLEEPVQDNQRIPRWGKQKEGDVKVPSTGRTYTVHNVPRSLRVTRNVYRKQYENSEATKRIRKWQRPELPPLINVAPESDKQPLEKGRPLVKGLYGNTTRQEATHVTPIGEEAATMERQMEKPMLYPGTVPTRGHKWGDKKLDGSFVQLPGSKNVLVDLYAGSNLVDIENYSREVARQQLTHLQQIAARDKHGKTGEEVVCELKPSHVAALQLGQEESPVHVVPMQKGLNKFNTTFARTPTEIRATYIVAKESSMNEVVNFLEMNLAEDGIISVRTVGARLDYNTRMQVGAYSTDKEKFEFIYAACANQLLYIPFALAAENKMWDNDYVTMFTFATLNGDIVHILPSAFMKKGTTGTLHPRLVEFMVKQDNSVFDNQEFLVWYDMMEHERRFKGSFGHNLGVFNWDIQVGVRDINGGSPPIGEGPDVALFTMITTTVDISNSQANAQWKSAEPNELMKAHVAATVEAPRGCFPHRPILGDFDEENNDFAPKRMVDLAVIDNLAKYKSEGTLTLAALDSLVVACMIYAPLQEAREENTVIRPTVQRLLMRTDMAGFYTRTIDLQAIDENAQAEAVTSILAIDLRQEQKRSGTHKPHAKASAYTEYATRYTVDKITELKDEIATKAGKEGKQTPVNIQLIMNVLIKGTSDVFETILLMMTRECALQEVPVTMRDLSMAHWLSRCYYMSTRVHLLNNELPIQQSVVMRTAMKVVGGPHPLSAEIQLEHKMMTMLHSPLLVRPPPLVAIMQGEAFGKVYCSPKPVVPYAIVLPERKMAVAPELKNDERYEEEIVTWTWVKAERNETKKLMEGEMKHRIWEHVDNVEELFTLEYMDLEKAPPVGYYILARISEEYMLASNMSNEEWNRILKYLLDDWENNVNKNEWLLRWKQNVAQLEKVNNTQIQLAEQKMKDYLTLYEYWFKKENLNKDMQYSKRLQELRRTSSFDQMEFAYDESELMHPAPDMYDRGETDPDMDWHAKDTRTPFFRHFAQQVVSETSRRLWVRVKEEREAFVGLVMKQDAEKSVAIFVKWRTGQVNWNKLEREVFLYLQRQCEYMGLKLPVIGLPTEKPEQKFSELDPMFVDLGFLHAGEEMQKTALVRADTLKDKNQKITALEHKVVRLEAVVQANQEKEKKQEEDEQTRMGYCEEYNKRVKSREGMVQPFGAHPALRMSFTEFSQDYIAPYESFGELVEEVEKNVKRMTAESEQTAVAWTRLWAMANLTDNVKQAPMVGVMFREHTIHRKLNKMAEERFLNEGSTANAGTTTLDLYEPAKDEKKKQKGTEGIESRASVGGAVNFWESQAQKKYEDQGNFADLPTDVLNKTQAGEKVEDIYLHARQLGVIAHAKIETDAMVDTIVRRTPRAQPPYRRDDEELFYGSDDGAGEKAVTRCMGDRYKKQQLDFPKFNPYYKMSQEVKRLGGVKMEVLEEGVPGLGSEEVEHQSRQDWRGGARGGYRGRGDRGGRRGGSSGFRGGRGRSNWSGNRTGGTDTTIEESTGTNTTPLASSRGGFGGGFGGGNISQSQPQESNQFARPYPVRGRGGVFVHSGAAKRSNERDFSTDRKRSNMEAQVKVDYDAIFESEPFLAQIEDVMGQIVLRTEDGTVDGLTWRDEAKFEALKLDMWAQAPENVTTLEHYLFGYLPVQQQIIDRFVLCARCLFRKRKGLCPNQKCRDYNQVMKGLPPSVAIPLSSDRQMDNSFLDSYQIKYGVRFARPRTYITNMSRRIKPLEDLVVEARRNATEEEPTEEEEPERQTFPKKTHVPFSTDMSSASVSGPRDEDGFVHTVPLDDEDMSSRQPGSKVSSRIGPELKRRIDKSYEEEKQQERSSGRRSSQSSGSEKLTDEQKQVVKELRKNLLELKEQVERTAQSAMRKVAVGAIAKVPNKDRNESNENRNTELELAGWRVKNMLPMLLGGIAALSRVEFNNLVCGIERLKEKAVDYCKRHDNHYAARIKKAKEVQTQARAASPPESVVSGFPEGTVTGSQRGGAKLSGVMRIGGPWIYREAKKTYVNENQLVRTPCAGELLAAIEMFKQERRPADYINELLPDQAYVLAMAFQDAVESRSPGDFWIKLTPDVLAYYGIYHEDDEVVEEQEDEEMVETPVVYSKMRVGQNKQFQYSSALGQCLDEQGKVQKWCSQCHCMGHIVDRCKRKYTKVIPEDQCFAPGIETYLSKTDEQFYYQDEMTNDRIILDKHFRPVVEPIGVPLVPTTTEDGRMTDARKLMYAPLENVRELKFEVHHHLLKSYQDYCIERSREFEEKERKDVTAKSGR